MRRALCVIVLSISLIAAKQGVAGVINVSGDTGDGTVDVNGLPQDFTATVLRTGVGGNNVRGLASIHFFALPNLSSRSSLVGADLGLSYLGLATGSPGIFVNPEFNVDLFGLGARSTPTILSTDYYDGDASLSGDSLIEADFITPSTGVGSLHSSGTSLFDFVSSLYNADGTPVAAFAVFRTNADVHLPVFSGRLRGYDVATADNTDSGGILVPTLTISTVPEPSTLALLVVGVASLGFRVSRKHRSDGRGW